MRPRMTLPGMEALVVPGLPAKLLAMHQLHGIREGRCCGQCQHLVRRDYGSHVYLKCGKTVWTHGAATDWRAGWMACGLIDEEAEDDGREG